MSITKKQLISIGVATVMLGVLTVALLHDFHKATHHYPPTVTTIPKPVQPLDAAAVASNVNNERVKAGLQPLVDDTLLDKSAAAKCADMVARNYYSHVTPDGQQPWVFFTAAGAYYQAAAENLAAGPSYTAQSVTDAWMASPGHRANILNPKYTHEGIAICHGSHFVTYGSVDIYVQQFDLPQ